MSRITWSTAAKGERVVPCVLLHGLPAILVPEGMPTLSAVSITSPPSLWWPGNTLANWTANVKPWIDLSQGFEFAERAVPTQPQMLEVSEIEFLLSDVAGAATALFAQRDSAVATFVAQDVAPSDAAITVVSTSAFPSSGTLYLGRETLTYLGVTSTSFTGCSRGRYGSTAQRHFAATTILQALGSPPVLDAPAEIVGRLASVWMLRVSGTTLTHASLLFVGHVGPGAILAEKNHWRLTLDHAVKRLNMPVRGEAVTVGGYVHRGNRGARGATSIGHGLSAADVLNPFRLIISTASAITHVLTLTEDDAVPDRGGWHPTRESFVEDLQAAATATFTGGESCAIALAGDGRLAVRAQVTTSSYSSLEWAWDNPSARNNGDTAAFGHNYRSTDPMPRAWVPILRDSAVYLSAEDYALVPPVPSLPGVANTTVYYALAFGDDRSGKRYAKITATSASGGVYRLTVDALAANPLTTAGLGSRLLTLERLGYRAGWILTEPTAARLCLVVSSDSWVRALQYALTSLDADFADVASAAIDWDHMDAVAAATPCPLGRRREAVVLDLASSPLAILANECALNGLCLTTRDGRLTVQRITEQAVTEPTVGALSSSDLVRGSADPEPEAAPDGIVNAYLLEFPEAAAPMPFVDATSVAAYGPGRTQIKAVVPRGIAPNGIDGRGLAARIAVQAAAVLGPYRYPYEYVTVAVGLHKFDWQVGDKLAVTSLWRVPNRRRTRGLTDALVQVVGRRVVFFGEGTKGEVEYTVRLNRANLAGYAPEALVAAGGISGANVTCDTTTFGAAGFAPSGTDGGASTFEVGDLVRLVEIDSTSPTSSTQHTVTAVSGAVLTLSPSPSATFATLAASALKVLVTYDAWTVITVGARTRQQRYAFQAADDGTLDASTGARIYAA